MHQNNKQNFINWLNIYLPASAGKYSGAIDTITDELFTHHLITKRIYLINNSNEIDEIIDKYLSVPEFRSKNITGNNMYSAALKKYKKFLESTSREEYNLGNL
jgi:hypothetical protein